MPRASNAAPPIRFNERLVLFKYFLSLFDVTSLKAFSDFNNVKFEGLNEQGSTRFYAELVNSPAYNTRLAISPDKLREYDNNICRHARQIGEKRGGFNLKYFQYFALLFTEIYLDRFFNDKENFIAELNQYIAENDNGGALKSGGYTPGGLNRLAFMCATGSGKTLIMHINILQFLRYYNAARRHNHNIEINKIILLSPNEGMSLQHLDEFKLSNIPASLFRKEGGGLEFSKGDIVVIDMNKLKEEGRVKTVSIDSFEQNNVVLVDEAHRGLQGDIWKDYRDRLSAEGGFAFEYSATFKQALKSLRVCPENEALLNEYGKSIIIDYSYKYFYEDGYGKDYNIYNLQKSFDKEEQQAIYLTGCLLSFFQQVKLYNDNAAQIKPYGIESPLLVFVGNRVSAPVKSGGLSKDEKELLTDIETVLLFIDRFVQNKRKTIERLKKVLSATTGIIDNKGADLFSQKFLSLESSYRKNSSQEHIAEHIYEDILRQVFNFPVQAESGRLHIADLKAQGEIGLKIGEEGEYFGVINIGDTSNLLRNCEQKGVIRNADALFSVSLFRDINEASSKIRILIGSRKFTEGWNCWRVSTMGLINFAKGEGSQAIQLFGRGVRLHGYMGRLKRSARADNAPAKQPAYLRLLETLTIFGIKADYMAEFKKFLEIEELPPDTGIHDFSLLTVRRYNQAKGKNLKVLRIKEGVDFKKQAARFILDVPQDELCGDYMIKNKIIIDCRAKVQGISSDASKQAGVPAPAAGNTLQKKFLKYLDYDYIYWQLLRYKNEKGYYNLTIERHAAARIMANDDWEYSLIVPDAELQIDTMEKADKATLYITLVLQSYIDKYYVYQKNKWEDPWLEYQDFEEDDPDFVSDYSFYYYGDGNNGYDAKLEELRKFVEDLNSLLERDKGKLKKEYKIFSGNLIAFDFPRHLYSPLICKYNKLTCVAVSPVSLNKDEKKFVDCLHSYINANDEWLKTMDILDLFLLRNKSKAGMGFFEAGNFYPDYILWVNKSDTQLMTFIDPKGLLRHQKDDPKMRFYKTIKELENRPRLQASKGAKNIILNSFIVTGTPYAELKRWWCLDKKALAAMNVLCLDQDDCVKDMMEKIVGAAPLPCQAGV